MVEWIGIPKDLTPYVGMVYRIKELDTGMSYIGIKKFWKKKRVSNSKNKKRRKYKLISSDWKTYNSSNKIMQEKLVKNPDNYEKSVIKCCHSVTEMKALEAYIQLWYYFNGKWSELYNEYIGFRLRIRK